MAIDTHPLEIKLIRPADGQEIDLLPLQGLWTIEQYLKLTDQTNQLIEFTDGVIEVLPMPTVSRAPRICRPSRRYCLLCPTARANSSRHVSRA